MVEKILIFYNRAGWNKRAEGANFETSINKQGEQIGNVKNICQKIKDLY